MSVNSQMNLQKPQRELKVEDALLYLDQVKVEFTDKPHIYNEFLDIMKNFKSQSINTPGVIEKVKNLFKGYNKLILGFNTFLPEGEGYKIELSPEEEAQGINYGSTTSAVLLPPALSATPAPMTNPSVTIPPLVAAVPSGAVNSNPGSSVPGQMQQAHAIHYVTKIRNRFSHEPDTYRQFLKILHTYQKEQKGIKEVLEQVSILFADHPDLLTEFTYFLPDAVQEQAKERLEKAARESEARRAGGKILKPKGKTQLSALPGPTVAVPVTIQQSFSNIVLTDPVSGQKRGRETRPDGHQLAEDSSGILPPPAKKQAHQNAQSSIVGGLIPPNGVTKKQSRRKSAPSLATSDSLVASASQPIPVRRDSHLSISAERRFFDNVKESLLSQSRDSWSDFVKCLDMFANDAISKDELLDLLSDVLGPQRQDMLHEFQRLLENRVDYQERKEDLWFSVPLSEIDYSQCRKCTPSYRALPRDYPKPICSERNEEEEKMLNDIWVSIPIGSEESYSFKHMRKNQFEESLFRCEDDRFEVDMLIDTNMSAIRALEPLNDEILSFKQWVSKRGKENGHENNPLPRFHFQLEKRQLSTVHLNAIQRIYGEHGEEMLELLRKNPATAIPVILKRLRQKDAEWRRARQDLNRQWKETIEKNFYKSFDHRSFYFRQHDKKFLHTKQLVAELSSFGHNDTAHDPNNSGILGGLESSYVTQFAGMNPAMCLSYSHDVHWIHRSIYRILCHSMDCSGSFSLSDKERIAALWRDLFRILFGLPVHYLYNDDSSRKLETIPSESYAVGTRILTKYGSGIVKSFREHDDMYCVVLAFGCAYLTTSAIYGAEQLSTQALSAIGVTADSQSGSMMIFDSEINSDSSSAEVAEFPCELFFGTQLVYIFLRLHHTLFVRLQTAWCLAKEQEVERNQGKDADARKGERASSIFTQFYTALLALAEGSLDSNRFEDLSRSLLGNKSFVVFTLDKIVSQILKHLQAIANDENVNKLIGLFVFHRNRKFLNGSNGVDVNLYRAHVAHILRHTAEDVFRFQYLCSTDGIMASHHELAIQHIGVLPLSNSTDEVRALAKVEGLVDVEGDGSDDGLVDRDTRLASSPKTPKAVESDADDEESLLAESDDDEDSHKSV